MSDARLKKVWVRVRWRKIRTALIGSPEFASSEYEHPQHPPNQKNRDNGPREVNDPVRRGLWFPKIEHAAIVAGGRHFSAHSATSLQSGTENAIN